MKSLLLRLGAIVLLAGVASCGAGFAVSRTGGAATGVGVARDLGIIVLAILSLVMAAAWASIYLGAAWAIERFGNKGVEAVRWVGEKVLKVDGAVERGVERIVIRPMARAGAGIATAVTFVQRLSHRSDGVQQHAPALATISSFVRQLHRAPGHRPSAIYGDRASQVVSGLAVAERVAQGGSEAAHAPHLVDQPVPNSVTGSATRHVQTSPVDGEQP